jgi:citrate lyase gamma subunit
MNLSNFKESEMKQLRIGSIESSDLMLEWIDSEGKLDFHNITAGIDENIPKAILVKALADLNLDNSKINAYYNGADLWVMIARCQALAKTLQQIKPFNLSDSFINKAMVRSKQ